MRLFDGRRSRDAATATGVDLPQANTLAIERYDRLAVWKLLRRLPTLSQTEMAAVETYERAHGQRVPVLRKLRYLRCDEPLAGYDALSPDEISAALKDADLASIDRVRAYERRLRNRDSVLVEIERLRVPFRRPATAQRPAPPNWG
jgi:hypothetical protein